MKRQCSSLAIVNYCHATTYYSTVVLDDQRETVRLRCLAREMLNAITSVLVYVNETLDTNKV